MTNALYYTAVRETASGSSVRVYMYQILFKMQVCIPSRTYVCATLLGIGIAMLTLCTAPHSLAAATLLQKKTPTVAQKKPLKTSSKKIVPKSTETIPERAAFFPATGGDTKNSPQQTISLSYVRTAPKLSATELEVRAREATINIVCTIRTRTSTRSSVGSGVIISQDGYVLTNAHVGIYSLFPQPRTTPAATNCVGRTGSPATYAFNLEPVYIPRTWVAQYADKLFSENLRGTGASDYMLLKVLPTGTPPTPLPFVKPDVTMGALIPKDVVLGGGYPAEFLGIETVENGLAYAASYITVGDALTFTSNTPDTFTLPGTILARAGISGGPVVDFWGSLVGIMSTSTREGTTAERTLRAISLDYINRDLTSSISLPLVTLINPTEQALREGQSSRVYAEALLGSLYMQ